MKKRLTMWAACCMMAAVGITTGCCCQAKDTVQDGKVHPQPTPEKPMKAMTPDGTVVWVISVWDVEPMPCNGEKSPCKTAKCWKSKDGKVYCVKPLKSCPHMKHCNGEQFKDKKTGKVMQVIHDPAEVKKDTPHVAKGIKACSKKGSAKCGAAEHINTAEKQKACNIKADQKLKEATAQNKPADMGDTVLEDDFFIISAVD